MMRHLMIAGLLLGMGMNTAAAETPDDKPSAGDDAVSAGDMGIESADKQGRGGSGKGNGSKNGARSSQGHSGQRSAARPSSSQGQRPAAQGQRPAAQGQRPTTTATRSTAAHRPSQSARPSNSSRAHSQSASRAVRPSAARPGASGTRHSNTVASHARPGSAARPSATRPGSASRPSAARPGGRPAHHVYRPNWAPSRWAPSYHRYHLRGVPRYSPRYWGAGVFVYSPPPRRHNVVVVNRTVTGAKAGRHDTKPTRAVNRNGDFGIGLSAGSYMTGYENGGGYGDMGLGLTARFRPVEAIGLEVSYAHHSQSWDDGSERINNPLQTSVNVYAFPWTRVSPYATVGLTWNNRQINDDYYDDDSMEYTVVSQQDTLFGPHAGLGMEFAIGDSAALNFEGRYVSYLNMDDADISAPNAVQGTMGLSFYF